MFIFKLLSKILIVSVVWVPVMTILIWYARDAVRLSDITQIQTAINMYQLNSSRSSYPDSLDDLATAKLLAKTPTDPINSIDISKMDKLFSLMGFKDVMWQKDITARNGFKYIYVTDPAKKNFEVSTKFESIFFQKRMQEDWWNDKNRYEVWTDLKLDSSFSWWTDFKPIDLPTWSASDSLLKQLDPWTSWSSTPKESTSTSSSNQEPWKKESPLDLLKRIKK